MRYSRGCSNMQTSHNLRYKRSRITSILLKPLFYFLHLLCSNLCFDWFLLPLLALGFKHIPHYCFCAGLLVMKLVCLPLFLAPWTHSSLSAHCLVQRYEDQVIEWCERSEEEQAQLTSPLSFLVRIVLPDGSLSAKQPRSPSQVSSLTRNWSLIALITKNPPLTGHDPHADLHLLPHRFPQTGGVHPMALFKSGCASFAKYFVVGV